jgi:hypothetical protein
MKKLFWINPLIFTAILLLVACKKEPASDDTEGQYIHWPEVKTLEATKVDSVTVKLNGTVNPHGLSTTVTFEYGTTSFYGNTVTACQSPVTGDSITHVSADISIRGCSPFHYCVKAENSKWTNFYSSDLTFSPGVSGTEPALMTNPVSGITATSAIVGGNIIDDGGADITERGVIWREGLCVSIVCLRYLKDDSTGTGQFYCLLNGLKPNTSYCVHSYAMTCLTYSSGMGYIQNLGRGNIICFTTSSK